MKSYKLNSSAQISTDQLPKLTFNYRGITSALLLDSTEQINILYDMASTDYFSVEKNGYCKELDRILNRNALKDLLESGILAEKDSPHQDSPLEKRPNAWQLDEPKKLFNHGLTRIKVDISQTGEHIFIYDNFFLHEIRRKILSWVMQDVDREDTAEYAHYIYTLSPASLFVQALPFTRAIHAFLSANFSLTEAHLMRAHVYAGSMADTYFEHTDGKGSTLLTSVYYPGMWEENWGGELLLKAGNEHFHAFSPTTGRRLGPCLNLPAS